MCDTVRMSKVVDLRGKKPKAPERPPVRRANTRSRRESPARTRRYKRHGLRSGVALVLVVGLAWAVSWASYLPQLRLTHIEVSGTHALSSNIVRAVAEAQVYDGRWFVAPDDILAFPAAAIVRTLESFPRIASASVTRPSPLSQTASVVVVEREPYARWCASASDCYLMDDGGFIFARAVDETPRSPVVFMGAIASTTNPIGMRFEPEHFAAIKSFVERFAETEYVPSVVTMGEGSDFTVTLPTFSVLASLGEDPATLIRNLELALQSETLARATSSLEYVDLRFGDRVYFKTGGER
jgi:hypothetical protein